MTIPTKILAIDDEPDVTRSIRLTIAVQEPEWTVVEASSGEEGLLLLSREKPDLVLLDLRMPGMTGLETLRRIRAFSNVPVIVLTVTNNELDEVNSLEEGADDYITKPFGHLELVAHIKSVLRRTRGYETEHENIYRDGEFSIDFSRRIVAIGSKEVLLTSTEYALLKILADNPGQTIPAETLLARVWGPNALDNRNYLKVYVRRLREKIEKNPAEPEYLISVRGLGYRLERHTK
jgi:two-component system KDP operon response regulator KdpE